MRIFELDKNMPEEHIKEFAGTVSANCKPYLEAIDYDVKHNALFRGMGEESSQMVHKTVRLNDRRPADTPIQIHDMLNEYFKKRFGAEFRNAIFVSGAQHVTLSFGNLYAIFPKGKFDFIYSPEVFDLWVEHRRNLRAFLQVDDLDKIFDNYMDNMGYTNKNFKEAIDSNKEIMIRCESYYAFRMDTLSDLSIEVPDGIAIRQPDAADKILARLEEEIRLNK